MLKKLKLDDAFTSPVRWWLGTKRRKDATVLKASSAVRLKPPCER